MGFIVFKYLLSTQASMTNKPRPTRRQVGVNLTAPLEQRERDAEAAAAWSELLADASPEAPWLAVARASLREANTRLGIEGSPAPAPTSEDIAAAGAKIVDRKLQSRFS